jgi:hypothetical protein
MASEDGFRFTPNVVVGLTLTIAGGVLMLDTLDMLDARDAARFWPVLLVLFGLSVIVQALQRGSNGMSPGGGQRPIVTPGFVIMFVVIGLLVSNAFQRRDRGSDGSSQTVFAVMGRTTRTSTAAPFRGADMTTLMGRSRLDLRQAMLGPGEEAVIDVFGMMGAVEVVVPEDWDVEVEAIPLMGRVSDRRFLPARVRDAPELDLPDGADAVSQAGTGPAPAGPDGIVPPRVILRGFIMMGALQIES